MSVTKLAVRTEAAALHSCATSPHQPLPRLSAETSFLLPSLSSCSSLPSPGPAHRPCWRRHPQPFLQGRSPASAPAQARARHRGLQSTVDPQWRGWRQQPWRFPLRPGPLSPGPRRAEWSGAERLPRCRRTGRLCRAEAASWAPGREPPPRLPPPQPRRREGGAGKLPPPRPAPSEGAKRRSVLPPPAPAASGPPVGTPGRREPRPAPAREQPLWGQLWWQPPGCPRVPTASQPLHCDCVEVSWRGRTRRRHHLLFQDALAIAKRRCGTSFWLQHRVRLSELWVLCSEKAACGCAQEETALGLDCCRTLIRIWPSSFRVVTFCSQERKELWLDATLSR
ncbi:uncharacterized protein LOC141935909 [Strix uralensis]|uniref:uncharacterized protein LOC141935909 n=1 Tax=Strix uralensis TaxID=36305 RepID=UPI003DA763D1